MIDTHCHLTFPQYEGRLGQVLADAGAEGVTGAITISTDHRNAAEGVKLAEQFDRVWCSAGVHPLYSDRTPHDWGEIERIIRHPKCVAWGELGLDNHYNEPAKRAQMAALEQHLDVIARAAPEVDKPVVLHCREAYGELIPILRNSLIKPERFVFHCFTSGLEDARACLDFGAMLSFTGQVTFKKSASTQAAAKAAPLERIMVETDAPFMTPEPYRKVKTCEPKHAAVTARFLAELRGEQWGVFEAGINANAKRFFGVSC